MASRAGLLGMSPEGPPGILTSRGRSVTCSDHGKQCHEIKTRQGFHPAKPIFFRICQQNILHIWDLLVIFKIFLHTREGAPHPTSVPVGLGSPILWARALFRSKVDEFVPQTQHVN
jgi:hypothetical protein